MQRSCATAFSVAQFDLPTRAADPGRALLPPLGRAGWLLLAIWIAQSGWSLRRLVQPSAPVGWFSLGSAAAVAALAMTELLRHVKGGLQLPEGSLAMLPLAVWSAGVVAVSCAGRFVTPEAPPE